MKAEAELPEDHDSILALMDGRLTLSASTGEPKVFYNKAGMEEQASKLDGDCAAQAREWEELQRLRAEGLVTVRDTNKLLNDCELIPKWFNVVKGVVDSEDLPLNVFRETLLQNKILRVIKKNLVTKHLEMLSEIAEFKDAYRKLYEQLVRCMKLGIHENSVDGVEIAELLRFNTSGDEQINLKEYVDRMKEGQNDICYITGENIAVVSSSSFSEDLRKKGYEVLYMVDPMDEYAVHQPKEFNGMRPKSTTKKELDLGDQDEKKTLEELNMEPETSRKLMKETLGDKVDEVIVSNRMVDSLRAHTASEHGWSTNMKHCTRQQHNNYHSKQAMQQRERKEEKGQGEREREGKKR